jgi:hypothetical protein
MSCPAWRNGWLMVDGTLVPLFRRPSWFGNIWFDRKSNYSLNVQVSNLIPYFVGTYTHVFSWFQHLIVGSWISVLVFQEVNMMHQPGKRH